MPYLNQWIDQLRWQRLKPFQKLAEMLLGHLETILNYCRVPVRFGVVEAVNGNINALLRLRARIQESPLLDAERSGWPHSKRNSWVLRKAA